MEKTLKHELYKHGSYLISLKESGSSFVNIDDEIKKNEELFQMASKKDQVASFASEVEMCKYKYNELKPLYEQMCQAKKDLIRKNKELDRQLPFAVGEYYADEKFIYHILEVRKGTNRLVNSLEMATGITHKNLVWTYERLREPKPATAEQKATF